MSDFLRTITHARRLKRELQELGVEQLEEVKIKLQEIIDNRLAEEEATRIKDFEKTEKIRKYKELLYKEGIDPNELVDSERQNKRAARKPKYEIWSEAGEHITWTGQGRMPNVFKARIEAGEPLETFLIDE